MPALFFLVAAVVVVVVVASFCKAPACVLCGEKWVDD